MYLNNELQINRGIMIDNRVRVMIIIDNNDRLMMVIMNDNNDGQMNQSKSPPIPYSSSSTGYGSGAFFFDSAGFLAYYFLAGAGALPADPTFEIPALIS